MSVEVQFPVNVLIMDVVKALSQDSVQQLVVELIFTSCCRRMGVTRSMTVSCVQLLCWLARRALVFRYGDLGMVLLFMVRFSCVHCCVGVTLMCSYGDVGTDGSDGFSGHGYFHVCLFCAGFGLQADFVELCVLLSASSLVSCVQLPSGQDARHLGRYDQKDSYRQRQWHVHGWFCWYLCLLHCARLLGCWGSGRARRRQWQWLVHGWF